MVSAFSIVELVLLSNENLGIGETEVLGPENGAAYDQAVVERVMKSGFRPKVSHWPTR